MNKELQKIKEQIKEMPLSEINDLLLIINAEFSSRIQKLYKIGEKLKWILYLAEE